MQNNLSDLLKQREGESLDFKQKITSYDKIAKTICSFANTRGGIILVGVTDKREVSGIDPEEEKFMLEQAAGKYCQPPIPLTFEELEGEDELIILKVTVEESTDKPHVSLSKAGKWQVYVRHKDKSVPAGKTLTRNLQQGIAYTKNVADAKLDRNESKIMQHLKINERITVKELSNLINFSRRRAESLLSGMVNKGLIRLFEHEQENYYA